jgi:chromosome segregation protein
LLKLKRVEIQGFKSFYDRTEMKFSGSGIAAVVGPNGCGKSNLSDAISWVLGEQSAKSLRGARMEDVIFAGTREKKPLSMASVTMTLVPDEASLTPAPPIATEHENRAPEGATPEIVPDVEQNGNGTHAHGNVPKAEVVKAAERRGEITITRRLYRSGESEYLVNGKISRLRDIQDLFFGTGLGPESYAIIEQGRIGQILSNKPQDRRNVIEEAAGITRFKAKKRLAEAKLESAKQNLARVFDILEEVNRQVNSLKRQASKTRRYSELKAEATGYLRQVLGAKFQILERETARLAIELNLATTELQAAQTAIAEHERDQSQVMEQSLSTEQASAEARKILGELNLEAERARSKLEYQLRQIQQMEQRLTANEQESAALAAQRGERAREIESQIAAVEAIDNELRSAREELAVRADERQRAQSRLAEQERGLEASRQMVLRQLGESSSLKNRITHLEAQLASSDRDTARARADEQQSEADLTRIQKQKAQISEQLAARQTELVSVADHRKEIEEQLRDSRSRVGEARHLVEKVRGEFSRVKARRDSLDEIIQHRSYTTETVKRLFTAVERGKAADLKPVGVLADFLEVDPKIERAVEEFLHDELEYVVVREWAAAERGIELMRGDLNGRATFLVESAGEIAADPADFPRCPETRQDLTKLTDSLRLTNGLTKLPLQFLPRIEQCFVVADRELAQRLAVEYPHCWFLAADGVSYHGHSVSGGKKTGAGPLGLKRELREVTLLESAKEKELTAAQIALKDLEQTISSLNERLETLRSQQQAQEKTVLALDHETRKLGEEFQRVGNRLSHARLELDRVSRDRVKLTEQLDRDRLALEKAEAARSEQEAALEGAREELKDLQAQLSRTNEEHASMRANLASLEERQRSTAGHRARLENQLRDLMNRQAHLEEERKRIAAEREHFVSSNTELEKKREQLTGDIATLQQRSSELGAQETALRSRLAEIDEKLKQLRQAGQAALERRSELQVAMARAESDLRHLQETCEKELETTLPELTQGLETIPDEAGIASLDEKYVEVRRKIEALGPVNPQAVEELEEAEGRQEFLNAQRQDLLDSIRDTEKAIHEIDGESRKRFGEAFRAINANFKNMFTTLFGGGTGEMRLTDEDNIGESGIDIVASPPGKRLQSVLLLSGGEKSLTAMALLMGIFQYTPSPFCVLDEVDAPLDEPNTERLNRLIREMAEETQFIVITHSKRTMEAAQSLYGVTMQEPGVSKLVSVKFRNDEEDGKRERAKITDEQLQPALTS